MADRSALASPVYAHAFEQVMVGVDPALLPADERQALVDARAAAGIDGPGYPMPAGLDPTSPAAAGPSTSDVVFEGGADGA